MQKRVAINIAESDNRDIEYHIVEVMRSHSEFSMMLMKEMDDSYLLSSCSYSLI